ncbi:MAG: helix-hairpin-helix domain-containing protein [Eubacterium sp.]|nr:helix-hairpin-helix domain-containing protein [Eubacterium sp.]
MTGKKQSLIVIGIALILIGVILAYFSLSQPKVYVGVDSPLPVDNSANVAVSENVTGYADSNEPIMMYPLNLNTCTVDELITIDGIGEAKASAIIEYREYIGGYSSVDEIKNIKGIGDALFEKLSPYLCV